MANKIKNKKSRTIPFRSDPQFVEELRELAKFRYLKGLEIKEPTDAEMTRLLRRTSSWKNSVFELKTKNRKENI